MVIYPSEARAERFFSGEAGPAAWRNTSTCRSTGRRWNWSSSSKTQYSIGERLRHTSWDVVALVVRANNTPVAERRERLVALRDKIEEVNVALAVAKELHVFSSNFSISPGRSWWKRLPGAFGAACHGHAAGSRVHPEH